MSVPNLATWPEIALFITNGENEIPDSKSNMCIVSDLMNWAVRHDPVWEMSLGAGHCHHPCHLSNSECSFAQDQCASRWQVVFSSCWYGVFPLYCHCEPTCGADNMWRSGQSKSCLRCPVKSEQFQFAQRKVIVLKLTYCTFHKKPLGYDLLIRIDVAWAQGDIEITLTRKVWLRRKRELCAAIRIDEPDFCSTFDHKKKVWTARWKWTRNKAPGHLCNRVYNVGWESDCVWEELQTWIKNGWLIPYPQELLGPLKGLILLMAITQPTNTKVWPVMHDREVNQYMDAFTANTDVFAKKMRCPWCNGYRHRKWTRRHEFKSWTRLIAFHIALIPLGKVWIQLFSLQLWVNSRAD